MSPSEHTRARVVPLKCMWSRSCEPGQPRPRTHERVGAPLCGFTCASQWLTRERGVELSRAPGLQAGGALPALGMGTDAGAVRLFCAGCPGTGGANMLRPVSLTVCAQRSPRWARIWGWLLALSTICRTCVLFDSSRGCPAMMQAVKYLTFQQTCERKSHGFRCCRSRFYPPRSCG